MVTFKVEVGKPQKDGSCAIYIKLNHGKERKRIRFFLDASYGDISDKGEIKNARLDMAINDTINSFKHKLYDAGMQVDSWSLSEIVNYLCKDYNNKGSEFALDFFEFGERHIETLIKNDRDNYARLFKTALNNFEKFIGRRKIDINEIDKALLISYEEWFKEQNFGERAWEAYMICLQRIHNLAKERYNDEDADELNIKRSPFKSIKFKIPANKKSEITKRALSATALRYLWDVPLELLNGRAMMARDAYFLSFALCGMNAIDMWKYNNAKTTDEKVIEYYRSKTVNATGENSFIRVHIHPKVMEVHLRHWTKYNKWDFSNYNNPYCFNDALRKGLLSLVDIAVSYYGKLFGIADRSIILDKMQLPKEGKIDFYSARHSFATIAANDCGVSTDIVDRCQCHAINSVAARSYIKKDYRFADDTVDKVMSFVFNV